MTRRRQRRVSAALLLLISLVWIVILGLWLNSPKPELLYNNGTTEAAEIARSSPRAELCTRDLLIPQRAREVELSVQPLGSDGAPDPRERRLAVRVEAGGQVLKGRGSAAPGEGRLTAQLDGSVARTTLSGSVCVRSLAGTVGVMGGPSVRGTSELGGRAVHPEMIVEAVRYRTNPVMRLSFFSGEQTTALAQAPQVLKRASMFRPGWISPLTCVLLALLVLAALAVTGWALVTRLESWSARRWMLLIALVTLVNGVTWMVVTPPFHAPDEASHFAYVETLANRGMVGPDVGTKEPDLRRLQEQTQLFVVLHSDNKPPWFPAQEEDWQRYQQRTLHDHSAEGPTTAQQYAPIYYAAAVIPYKLTPGGVIGKSYGLRLFSILLTLATVLLVFLTAAELLPRLRWAAPVAGLLAAFQPMLLHIGAAAHLDPFVTFFSSLMIFFFARILRRGLNLGRALGVALSFAVAAVAKPIAFGLAPALLLAALILVVRDRRGASAALRDLAVAGAAAAVLIAAVYLSFDLTGAVAEEHLSGQGRFAPMHLSGFLGYAWQWFLPRTGSMFGWVDANWWSSPPPFFTIVVPGYFADFNYLDTSFPLVVYRVIVGLGLLLFGGSVAAAVRSWGRRRQWLPFTAFSVAAVAGITLLLLFTGYAMATGQGSSLIQGRYLLMLVTLASLFVVVGCVGLARRWAPVLAGSCVLLLALLNASGYIASLLRFYT